MIKNKELIKLYKNYLNELVKNGFYTIENGKIIKKDGSDYSNPYFVGIPKDWYENDLRIMIIGEEGNGELGKEWNKEGTDIIKYYQPDDIEDLQKANLEFVNGERPWNFKNVKGKTTESSNTSRFWQIFKKIEYLNNDLTIKDIQDENFRKAAVIWNECDKICHTTNKGKLSESERTKLHKKLEIDILKEEIKILQPTHIVFLGWYSKSLKINNFAKWSKNEEFNFKIDQYIKDDNNNAYITKGYIEGDVKLEEIKIYFVNHPQCSFKTKEYIEKYNKNIGEIISDIKQSY